MNPEMAIEQEPLAEFSPEIEAVREERVGMIGKIFTRKTADVVGNLLPGIDVPKLLTEAAYGTTLAGKDLSMRERMDYAVIAGLVTTAYILYFSGMPHEAKIARVTGATFSSIKFGPNILRETLALAKEKIPAMSPFIERSSSFIEDKKAIVEEMAGNVEAFMATNPDLFLGDLH